MELIDLVNYVIIFLSQMTLLRCLTFLLGSLIVTLTVLPFWIYLYLLTPLFVLQWLSLHWEILIMLLSQFPLTLHQTQNRMSRFIVQLMTILMLTGMVFMIMQEMSHGKILLSLMLPAASEFCEWVFVGINVYIPHHQKYQVKPDSSPWFSAACAAAIVQRNQFFVCTNKINFLNPK